MSIDALKQELATLRPSDQRILTAYLVSLQESHNQEYRTNLARKIDDRDPSHFASLKELDRRLGLDDSSGS